MPDVVKISALPVFADLAAGDLLPFVDVNATPPATGTTKQMTVAQLRDWIRTATTGISAAGSTQGTATALTNESNNVTIVGSGQGVILPAYVAAGKTITVKNSGANALLVYPPNSTQINALGNNTGYILPVGSVQTFVWLSSTLLMSTQLIVAASVIATEETQASGAAYGNLATVGPVVTLSTGTSVLVSLSAGILNSLAANYGYMSFAVSGATTRNPNDNDATVFGSAVGNIGATTASNIIVTGLNAGANTFTAKYRNGGGGGTWAFNRRSITVIPLN